MFEDLSAFASISMLSSLLSDRHSAFSSEKFYVKYINSIWLKWKYQHESWILYVVLPCCAVGFVCCLCCFLFFGFFICMHALPSFLLLINPFRKAFWVFFMSLKFWCLPSEGSSLLVHPVIFPEPQEVSWCLWGSAHHQWFFLDVKFEQLPSEFFLNCVVEWIIVCSPYWWF